MLTWVAACVVAAALFGVAPMIARGAVPDAPSNLVAMAGENDPLVIAVTWTPSTDPSVAGYNVYAAQAASGPFVRVASLSTTDTFDYATSGGLPYYLRVASVNGDGEESAYVSAGPVSALWGGSPHVAPTRDGVGCAQCHSPHLSDDSLQISEDLGSGPASTSCLGCHSGRVSSAANVASGTVDSFGLASGHTAATTTTAGGFEMAGCVTCHWAHGATTAERMIPARTINGTTVSSAGSQLCMSCHDASDSWHGPGYPSTASPNRDAAGYPVSGTWPGPTTYLSASNTHRLIPETTQTTSVDKPVRRDQGDCLYCHASHRGANAYDGLRDRFTAPTASTLASDQAQGTYAALCFDCHGGATPSGFSTPTVNIQQFATASGRGGHSIVTSGGTLPAGSPLPCYECHNPHGSRRGNGALVSDERGRGLIATDTAGATTTETAVAVRTFCFTCHTTPTGTGWNSVSEAYEAVSASDKIVGLTRTGGAEDSVLHLPNYVGHAETDTASCYSCHGNSYATGGNNVHNPGVGTSHMAVGSEACADCHGSDLLTVHAVSTTARAVAFVAAPLRFGSVGESSTLSGFTAAKPPVTNSYGFTTSLTGALCKTCHDGVYGDIASAVGSTECQDCHSDSQMPGHSWADTSTATTLGQQLLPHYASSVATHAVSTWDTGVSGTGGYACIQCHAAGLWDSHSGPTPISLDTSATAPRNTRCVACHSAMTEWGTQSAGTQCSACHPVIADHSDFAAKHDASSEVMASPGTWSQATTSAASVGQSFDATAWPADWTRDSSTFIRVQNDAARTRTTYATELYADDSTRRSHQFYKDIDLSDWDSATLTYWEYTAGFADGGDYSLAEYSTDGGTNWTTISNLTTSTAWTQQSVALPVGGVLRLRFGGSVNSITEYCDWDDIEVAGVQRFEADTPLPANSTAEVSCQNNPNGASCHVVSDVAAIHDSTAAKCTGCHTDSNTAPRLNCQSAGCHANVNRDTHL